MTPDFDPRNVDDWSWRDYACRLIVSFVGLCAVSVFWALLLYCALSAQP